MQHPRINTGSLGPWWDREEQTESMNILLMTGTRVSHNSGIPTFEGNLVSCVQASDNSNMFSALAG